MNSPLGKMSIKHLLTFFVIFFYCATITPLTSQAADGELIWQTRLAISYQDYYTNNEGHLAVAPSGEVIANQASYLYAFNTDGSKKWRKSLSDTVYIGVPVIGSDGTIYTDSGLTYYRAKKFGVIAYNPDGTIKWNRSDLSTPQIAVDNRNVVYLYDDKTLYALNADGTDKWQLSLAVGEGSPVIAADGTIYIRSSNQVFAVSAIGRLLWTYVAAANISTSLAISADGAIVFADEEKSLVMLNGDGTVKQQRTLSALPFGSPIIAKDNGLYFATSDKGILALAADGKEKWSYQTNGSASSLLLLQDGSLTFIVDNKLISLASDGQLNWQVAIEGQNSNIASDGSLYIHGLFVSFDPDSGRPHPYGLLTAFESSAGGLATSSWPKMAGNVQNSGLDKNASAATNNYSIDFETGKLDQAPMYLSGDSHWQLSEDKVKTGSYALKSPILTSENQQALFEITTSTKDHYLTFDFAVNSTQVDQQLSFYVDNVLKGRWYGQLDWQTFELAIEAGVHTFSWKFSSATALTGTQAAWLDNIHIVYSTSDIDEDGIADYLDEDNDNDGIIDNLDDQPLNASLSADYDRDGISDALDLDDDNDGVNDSVDLAPYDKNIGIASGDGLMLSSFKTMSGNILSSPAIADDGSIYIGSTDGRLYAFDNKGGLKWYYQSQGIITASPVIGDDGTIYIGSYDRNLYALNADGSLKWQVAMMTYIDTAPAIHPNGNIFMQANGLTIINSAGKILEQWPIYYFCSSNMASPSISPQGEIYHTYQQAYEYDSCGGRLSIHQSDGTTIASASAGSGASPAISADGTLYISNSYSHYDSSYSDYNPKKSRQLTAYTATGVKKWTTFFPESGGSLTSTVIADNNVIYMGADKFYALNDEGEILWSMATDHQDGFFTSTPAIATDGTIFVGASDQQLYAINPDGTKKWSFKTSGTILSSPTISPDGHVVFGSNDGRLYILNSDAGSLADAPWPMLGQNLNNSRFLKQDTDGDGEFDHIDSDDDNDGIVDSEDALIYDASEQHDFDGDSIGDNADTDDDNDGVPDVDDNEPLNDLVGASSGDGYLKNKTSDANTDKASDIDSLSFGPDGTRYGVGSNGQVLHAFNSDDSLKWQYLLEGQIGINSKNERVRITSNGTVVVSTGEYAWGYDYSYKGAATYAFSADGQLQWKYAPEDNAIHRTLGIGFDNVIYVSVVTEDDGYDTSTLVALLPNGEVKWRYSTARINEAVLTENSIYLTASNEQGVVIALDLSGTEQWLRHFEGDIYNPVIDAFGNIYMSSGDYGLSKFNALTSEGNIKWSLTLDKIEAEDTLVNIDGSVLFMQDSTLNSYDSNGELKWTYSLGSFSKTKNSSVIAADGTIFVATFDNKVHAITKDGDLRWVFQSKESIQSRLYLTELGALYFYAQNTNKPYFKYTINSDAGPIAKSTWSKQFSDERNTSQVTIDSDGDGLVNGVDDDDDNDGVLDVDDAFPIDASESIDTDGDGIGNNADTDDDNDGIYDEDDSAPLDASVGDEQAPVFALLDDLVIEAMGNTTELSAHFPEVTDNNYHMPVVEVSSNELTLGEHVVTWTTTDYAGNQSTVEQSITIVDTTPPLVAVADDINIKAQGHYSAINYSDINLKAFDLVDGDIQVEVNFDNKYLSGRHHVEITATDYSGNRSSESLTVNISPELSIAAEMQVEALGRYAITAHLSGVAVQYPVPLCVYLRRDGNIISTDCTASIESGRQATHWFVLRDVMELSVNSELLLEYEVGEYAYIGDNGVTKLTIIEHNSAPRLNIVMRQNNEPVSIIDPTKGNVTLVAQIDDVNSADEHEVTWHIDERIENNSTPVYGIYDNEPSVSFYPESLVDGQYVINVRVAENNTAEALHVNREISLSVSHAAELTDNDSDNDGVSDKDEGLKDSDGDGISDYLDNNINTTQLPVSHSFDVMRIAAGNKLSLGSYVQAVFKTASQSVNLTVEELSTVINDITNAADVDFEAITPPYNFTVREMQTAERLPMTIVMPLPSNLKLPNESFYRVFNKALGWKGYVENANNRLSSAPADELGNCPKINSILYLAGLNAGDNCLQLVITDGDSNDADGLNNGVVDFLGAIAIATEISNYAPNIAIDNHDNSYDENSQVAITAQASDADGDNLTYQWTQISGPNISLTNANSAQVSFTLAQVSKDEVIELQVSVSDGQLSASAQTSFTVKNVAAVKPTTPDAEKSSGGGALYWLLLMVFMLLAFKASAKLMVQGKPS